MQPPNITLVLIIGTHKQHVMERTESTIVRNRNMVGSLLNYNNNVDSSSMVIRQIIIPLNCVGSALPIFNVRERHPIKQGKASERVASVVS